MFKITKNIDVYLINLLFVITVNCCSGNFKNKQQIEINIKY